MQVLLSLFIGYAALYIVIYLHEVGHAIWYCRFGCKKNWYHVTVKPYLFFSTPLPVDINQADNLSTKRILSSLMEVYSIILFLLLLHISLFVDSI